MGLFGKIRAGLTKTRTQMSQSIQGAFGKGKLTEDTLEQLEEILLTADVHYEVAEGIVEKVRKACLGKEITNDALIEHLETFAGEYLVQTPTQDMEQKPHVILVLGINGVGKTTSIAKLANHYKAQGKKVLVAAGDTFRAGAIEQVATWCERLSIDLVQHEAGSDAAAVVYDAYSAAVARKCDILLIDTAGRLHNKEYLMEELKKLVRVLKKHDDTLPHETLMVLDGNTGQNAIPQAKAFDQVQPLDGFVVTKLDGTAKGGALLSINHEMNIPIRWVGVGEAVEDLIPFSPKEYAKGLFRNEEVAL
jgi:fused signal recognition particle receptor